MKIGAFFSPYNQREMTRCKTFFFMTVVIRVPQWCVKIDTVMNKQHLSIYIYGCKNTREEEFFPFCMFFLGRWSISLFRLFPRKISTRDLFTQKHLNFWKNIWCISSLELWTMEFNIFVINLVSSSREYRQIRSGEEDWHGRMDISQIRVVVVM